MRAAVKKQNPDAALHRKNGAGNVGLIPRVFASVLPDPEVLGIAQACQMFVITCRERAFWSCMPRKIIKPPPGASMRSNNTRN